MPRAIPVPARRAERGNAFVAMILLVIVMAALASAMMATAVQDRQRTRTSTELTRSHYVAEAGINRAIVDLEAGGAGNLGSENAPVAFSGGDYWVSSVDNGDDTHTITSRSVIRGERSAIEVVVRPVRINLFTVGLFGDLDLGASGSVFTDSFDSDLGTYASQAVNVHPVTGDTYARANGDLGSNADITIRGSVTVLGKATPGPGHSVTILGDEVHIDGSTAPASEFTPMQTVAYNPTVGSSGSLIMSGGNLDLAAGTHRYGDLKLSGSATITVKGDVTLYVDGDVSATANAMVVIEPGARLTMYHGSESFHLTGKGLWNQSRDSSKFVLYSTATDVKLTGNSGFHGAVYAPRATVEPVGTAEIHGSLVGSMIYVGGTATFHYDEALARKPELAIRGAMRVVSWRRVAFGVGEEVSETAVDGDEVDPPPMEE